MGPKPRKHFKSKAGAYQPHTAAELVDAGSAEEESGDRWHGSDICKALRFYQRAYNFYRQACRLQPAAEDRRLVNDAQYNASRLLYHVFTEYEKTDGVDLHRLDGIGEVLSSSDSVVKSIVSVIGVHEDTIDALAPGVPTDLLFNTAMAYTDAIEEFDSEEGVLQSARRAREILGQVLQQQVAALREENAEPEEPEEDEDDEAEKDEENPVSDLLDTVVAVFRLAQAVYENVSAQRHSDVEELLGQLVSESEAVAQELLARFGPLQPDSPISFEQASEYAVAKACAAAVSCASMDEVFAVWSGDQLPDAPERYMSAADCAETMLQKLGLNSTSQAGGDPQLYWDCLTKMNLLLKKAHEGLSAKLKFSKPTQDLGVGTLVQQIAKVHLGRADIDLQRSQLPLPAAQANSQVLVKNCRAFLTNALTAAKQSGGVRERAVEKSQREKRRVEAMVRLCVLDRATAQDLDQVVGPGRWKEDLETLQELWYYESCLAGISNGAE